MAVDKTLKLLKEFMIEFERLQKESGLSREELFELLNKIKTEEQYKSKMQTMKKY